MGKFKTALAALSLSAVTLVFGAEAPAEGELGRLDWIAGSWTGSDSGVESEEHWIVAKGGLMLGLHRDLHPSGRVFFEYLRIEKTDRGIHYVPSPGGRQTVSFGLVEIGERRVVFGNPDHDFPQRIIYWLVDDRTLGVRVEGVGGDGEPRIQEWRWKRS